MHETRIVALGSVLYDASFCESFHSESFCSSFLKGNIMKIGDRVFNVHQRHLIGTVVEVLDGCNALVAVIFDGRDFKSWLPVGDVALVNS